MHVQGQGVQPKCSRDQNGMKWCFFYRSEASRSAPSGRPVLPAVAQKNARNHPLFGVLDFIAAKTQSNTSAIAAVDVRLEKLADSVSRIAELQKEPKQLIEQQKESNFLIEKTKYKVNAFGLAS